MDAAAGPIAVTGEDIVGGEDDVGGAANQLHLLRIGFGSDKREHRVAIGRSNAEPAFAGLKNGVGDEAKAELVHVETQALVLIADENLDAVNAKD